MVTIQDGSVLVTSSETDLFSIVVGDKSYGCRIYLDPITTGDSFIFRQYVGDAGGTFTRKGKPVIQDGPPNPEDQYLYYAPEFAHRYKVTAQKLTGTDRTLKWERAEFA